jgi:hypothetical protein
MRIARGISVSNTSKPISTAIVYDADAAAFFTAASITDNTQKSAVNQLVLSLKSANIWTKMKALYPVVGGVASAHAINLKTPGTYNLTFQTGWTHSSTGMTPNGATYASSALVPSSVLVQNSSHVSYYSRTNNTGLYDFGHDWTSQTSLIYLLSRYSDSKSYYRVNAQNTGGTESSQTLADSLGLFTVNRNSASAQDLFKNTTKYTFNVNSFGLPSNSIILGGIFSGTFYGGSRQCAFASIGDGLTDAEASSFYTAVQNYQTTLGRQV